MPINKFTTLLDLARQAKILTGETATFDGKIQVGIPFSGYPTGVDTGTTVSLGIVSSQSAVFSGDTGTTVFDTSNPSSPYYDPSFDSFSAFTWSNPLFSAYTSGLTLPITFLSADTQIVGPFWTLTQTGNTGDYIIGTEYTGYSITYSFFNVISLNTGSTLFSGFTTASQENFSAGTLDYKGPLDYLSSKEDATIDGRLTTNKITITNGASASTIGYVLTQTGQNGEGEWQLSGVFTGNTSASCISDLYVSNIHSCSPLNINPLDEGNVYFGSTSGVTVDVLNSRLGIGTETPQYPLEILGSNSTFYYDPTSDGGRFNISGNTGVPRFDVSVAASGTRIASGGSVGMRNWNDGTYTGYGKVGDMFIYAGNETYGLNFINPPGTNQGTRPTEDYIRFYAGQSATGTADIHIQGSGTTRGFVGIGTELPTEKLHISGGDMLVENTNGKYYTDIQNATGPLTILSGNSSGVSRIGVIVPTFDSVTLGVRGPSAGSPGYGKQGDGFIYSSNANNGFNLISAPGTGTDDYIRFYAGTNATSTPDIHIQGSGVTRGYVGIGTSSPSYKLQVNGTYGSMSYDPNRVRVSGDTDAGTFDSELLLSGTTSGLTIINLVNGINSLGLISIGDDSGSTVYGNGGDTSIFNSSAARNLNIINSNGFGNDNIRFYAGQTASGTTPDIHIQGSGSTRGYVGIGTTSPSEKLDVSGKTKTTQLQVTTSPVNGYVLTSDGSGNATWQTPTGGGGTFTGGTVSALTNFISGLTTNEFTGDLGSSKTFYVSGNSASFQQMVLLTDFSLNQPAYVYVGRGVSQLGSESGLTINGEFRSEASSVRMRRLVSGVDQRIEFTPTGNQMSVQDNINLKGLEYFADYSSNYTNRSLVDKEYVDNQVGGVPAATTATTTTINFTGQTIYYDASSPGTGNISENLTGSKLGLIQKIYHNDVSEPTYPAGWVLMGDAIYFTSTLNVIYAEWAGGSRVEYWYVQEQ